MKRNLNYICLFFLLCLCFGCAHIQSEGMSRRSAIALAKSEALRRGFELSDYDTKLEKNRDGFWVVIFIYRPIPGIPGADFLILVESKNSVRFFGD